MTNPLSVGPIMNDEWQEIDPSNSEAEINVRRVDPTHPFDWFRGRDQRGRYLFKLEAKVGWTNEFEVPELAGIEVQICRSEEFVTAIVLGLKDDRQMDIFRALCMNLLESTRPSATAAHAAKVVVATLRRWHQLLRAAASSLLPESARIGLFGELLVLRDVFIGNCAGHVAVASWRGLHADEQDFSYGSSTIEVKTQLQTSDSKIQISSEHQLDRNSGRLFLCHQTLGTDASSTDSRTLNSLISEVLEHLSADPRACDLFRSVLYEWGYLEREEYNQDSWRLTGRRFYEVKEGFPVITPKTVPLGAGSVRYTVQLSACHQFSVADDAVMEATFHG